MVKRGLVIMLIIFAILLIIGSLYTMNLLSEISQEERKKSLIRSSNPPVPENLRPVGVPSRPLPLPNF